MGDRMLPPWREEWALFVSSLCANCETNSIPVNRITVDSSEIAHPDFVMLCSALQLARNVKHLVVGHDFVEDLDEDIPDALPPGIWDLISLTLMSNDSTTSVEALTIRGIPISDEDVGGITGMVTYSFPLSEFAAKWVMDDNPSRRPESKAPRTVRVTAGTTLTGHYGFDEEEYSFTINDATEALSVREEGELSYLFIRGRGFCYVPSSELPSKRARFTRLKREPNHGTSALLKFIEIVTSRNDAISPSHIADFVDNAGGLTLRCLKLRVPNLSEETLRAIMSTNPHLEHLVVSHLSLTSMAFIEDAIQSGVPLQSLALSKLSVAEDNLNAFLDKALSHDSKTRLQKLRLGPLAESTLEKLGTLLKVSSLRYLHCESSRPAPPSFEALVSYHHSESTGKVRVPLPNSSKVAFLEAMHHFTNLGIVLTDEMKAMICFLASTPDTRIVICSDLE